MRCRVLRGGGSGRRLARSFPQATNPCCIQSTHRRTHNWSKHHPPQTFFTTGEEVIRRQRKNLGALQRINSHTPSPFHPYKIVNRVHPDLLGVLPPSWRRWGMSCGQTRGPQKDVSVDELEELLPVSLASSVFTSLTHTTHTTTTRHTPPPAPWQPSLLVHQPPASRASWCAKTHPSRSNGKEEISLGSGPIIIRPISRPTSPPLTQGRGRCAPVPHPVQGVPTGVGRGQCRGGGARAEQDDGRLAQPPALFHLLHPAGGRAAGRRGKRPGARDCH